MIFSYTFLNTYHDICPRRAYEIYIAKSIPYTDTPATIEGKALHKAIERRMLHGAPLPPELATIEPICASFTGRGLKLAVEMKLGATKDWRPTDFFEKKAPDKIYDDTPRLRGVPDLNAYTTALQADAIIVDWKTGKPRDNYLQHSINAALVFAHYGRVQRITALNVYTRTGEIGERHSFGRGTLAQQHAHLARLMDEVEQAETFPERRSPLCQWCPVRACQHNRSAA